jgi:hypothetical protein
LMPGDHLNFEGCTAADKITCVRKGRAQRRCRGEGTGRGSTLHLSGGLEFPGTIITQMLATRSGLGNKTPTATSGRISEHHHTQVSPKTLSASTSRMATKRKLSISWVWSFSSQTMQPMRPSEPGSILTALLEHTKETCRCAY